MRFVVVLVALIPIAAFAVDASVDIGKIEGKYRRSFRSGDTSGAKYTVTDTFDLTQVGKGVVYFNLALNFYNGHECNLSGIARSEKGALVYRDDSDPQEKCELHIRVRKGRIEFDDLHNHCRNSSCGARGGYGGQTFSIAGRRKLSDKERKQALSDYRDEVKGEKKLP
jgi:hypothetical protein